MGINLGEIRKNNLATGLANPKSGGQITIGATPYKQSGSINTQSVEYKQKVLDKKKEQLAKASSQLRNYVSQNVDNRLNNSINPSVRNYKAPLSKPVSKTDLINSAKKVNDQEQKLYSSNTYKDLKENVKELSKDKDKAYREYRKAIGKDENPWYKEIFSTPENFKDGYDFGDITKTALSSAGDLALETIKGITSLGDAGGKLIASTGAQIGEWLGYDDWANEVRNKVAGKSENTNRMLKKWTPSGWVDTAKDEINKNSVFGNTVDEAMQGTGYYAGMLALQSIGVPWEATAAVSSIGNELSEAYANDATNVEAWVSAANSAAWEVASEFLSGGIKLPGTGKALDGVFSGLSEKLKSKTAKYLLEAGYQIGGEGLEEVISGFGSALGKKFTYMKNKDLDEIYSKEEALKDFVIGGAVAGLTNSVNPTTWHNIKSGKSLLTGRSSEEAKSRNETIKKLSTEAEKNKGNSLTSKEKTDIENYVDGELLNKLYSLKNDLQNAKDNGKKSSLSKQIENLQDKITKIASETKSLNILQYQLNTQKQIMQTSTNSAQNSAVSNENAVSSMLVQKNSIAPQQNTNPNNQLFQFTKTGNTKIDNFLQSAVDNGFNNTKQSQDFLNTFSKIISDKDYNVIFDSTINKNGQSVNGQITPLPNGEIEIRINPNSNQAGEFLIVHEVTHAIENDGLKDIIINYAKQHDDFETSLQDKMKLYGTNDVTSEVIADISGQLLGNQEFINSLTMENTTQSKTIIRKIYDSIKKLLNNFTSEGRYKNFVQDLEQKWREAYRTTTQEQAVNNINNRVNYSLENNENITYNSIEEAVNADERKAPYQKYSHCLDFFNLDYHTMRKVIAIGSKYALEARNRGLDGYSFSVGKKIYDLKILDEDSNTYGIINVNSIKDDVEEAYNSEEEVSRNNKVFNGQHELYQGSNNYDSESVRNRRTGKRVFRLAQTTTDNGLVQYESQSSRNIKGELDNSSFSLKEKQLDIILNSNPAGNDTATWIRNVEDIKTFEETLQDSDWSDYVDEGFNPDYTGDMVQEALDTGKITVYSSYPIEQGIFVTPSKMEAESYSGTGKVYSKEVNLTDVAWIDPTQGQYAKTDIKYSQSSDRWQQYLDRHYKATGTRTNMNSIKVPTMNKGLDNSSFSFVQEQSNRLTQKEQVELNSLNNLPFELSQEEQNRKTYLENKAKGLIKYPELSPKITFEDIRDNYSKYKNLSDFNSSILDKAESFITGYRNTSRRTKAEWLEVAKFIGANLNAKNSTELEKYAIQSWHSAKPNIKENLNRQGQGYVKFSIDEWVNQIYKSAGVGETIKETNNTKNSIKAPLKNNDTNKVVAPTRETLNSSSKVLNPLEISQLTPDDANTTQKLNSKQRKWVKTSTESNPVKGKVLIENLDSAKTNYVVRSNESTLQSANSKLNSLGYDESISYIKSKMSDKKVDLEDIALAERLIQESIKNGDTKTASDLIMDVAILGTELGQKVQALSIIQKLTPEGQLAMYQKIVSRAKTKGEKAYTDVNITQDMVDTILGAYNEDGTYNQDDLNERVEIFKQQVAEQLKSSKSEKINEWRYLSMLGNPKTHIRNMISNLAMTGTIKVKNAMARTGETIASKFTSIERTKTWKKSSDVVENFAKQTAEEMKGIISGESKYGEKASIESKKQVFKSKTLEKISDFNSNALETEDWFFSKRAFQNSLSEYLTANGIETQEDINNNAQLVEKAKLYAVEQAEIATFRQYSKLASLINKFERNNKVAGLAIGATIPFKKTPINVAKAGVNYSPIGLIKSISYDAFQLHRGNINASQFIDNVSQGMTGTALTLLGYALAKAGFVSGSGDDDKEGKMDYYLGNQSYSLKIGKTTLPISWVSPVAMPFLVGANAYEKLENQEEWDANIVIDTLAQTLDPLSEMSFVSSLTDVLQSYNQGSLKMLSSMGTKAAQSYIGQFFPTLFSQIAATFDDTKRSTSASKNSSFKVAEETVRQIMYKIPGLRNMLEPSTNIWGEEQKQSDNIFMRAFNNFINPSSPKTYAPTKLENELKRVYRETGDSSVIPGIPYGNIKYKGINYQMSAEEYTKYKKTYGQNAKQKLTSLIDNDDYKKATDEQKAKMINQIFDFSKAIANEEYFKSIKVDYSSDDLETINELKELGFNDKTMIDYAAKYALVSSIKQDKELSSEQKHKKIANELIDSKFNNKELAYIYEKAGYSKKEKLDDLITMNIPIKEFIKLDSSDITSDYDTNTGKAITNSKKAKYIKYIDSLKLSTPQKAILIKMEYNSYNNYNSQIVQYIGNLKETINDKKILLTKIGFDNYRKDVLNYIISKYKNKEDREKVLKELGYTVRNGKVYW